MNVFNAIGMSVQLFQSLIKRARLARIAQTELTNTHPHAVSSLITNRRGVHQWWCTRVQPRQRLHFTVGSHWCQGCVRASAWINRTSTNRSARTVLCSYHTLLRATIITQCTMCGRVCCGKRWAESSRLSK